MSHMDEGTLHALVDDALDAAERDAAQAHLAACGDCARRFAEATAMARQVRELLGALDEVPAPLRVQALATASRPVAPALGAVAPPQRRAPLVTLRRVALAASLLVVAGISYRMGGAGERAATPAQNGALSATALARPETAPAGAAANAATTTSPATVPSAPSTEPTSARLSTAPSAVAAPRTGAPSEVQSQVPSTPAPERTARRADVMEDRVVASSRAAEVAAPRQRAEAPAPAPVSDAAPEPSSAGARAAAVAVAPGAEQSSRVAASQAKAMPGGARTAVPLSGYTVVEEQSLPAVTRRRYLSSAGTALVLLIVQGTASEPDAIARSRIAAPEFVVRTANGTSAVRWTAQGQSYELSGALPPDSLVKLATQLR